MSDVEIQIIYICREVVRWEESSDYEISSFDFFNK